MLSFESTFIVLVVLVVVLLCLFILFNLFVCCFIVGLRYSLFTISDRGASRSISTSVEDYDPTDDLYLHSATSFSGALHKRPRRDVYVSPDEEEV